MSDTPNERIAASSPLAGPQLEQALQRHGDRLYRLALVLTPDPARAESALVGAARRLAAARPGGPEDEQLLRALLAALPAEKRAPRRPAPWAGRAQSDEDSALLAALARLPRPQRLAMALPLYQQSAEADPDAEQRAARRDALLALAPAAGFPDLPRELADPEAPEDCRAARSALVLDDPALHHDPSVRGHLALCDECRRLAHEWQRTATMADDALRAALRTAQLPPPLARRMVAATDPARRPPLVAVLTGAWARRALIPVGVLLLVAALVWPRGQPSEPASRPAQTGAPAADLGALVARASETLYEPPPGEGTWAQRFTMRWAFGDGTYAPLAATLWTDGTGGRTRMQIAHASGGGPYEFLLADGRTTLWYGATRAYADSLYPLIADPERLRVMLTLDRPGQQEAIAGRLQAGAWSLPFRYLRQAKGAQLQSWGQQQDADGAPLQVVSFQGVSPIVGPAGSSGGDVTVLLLISPSDGRLREIRELIGQSGGDQVSRTTWRAESTEAVAEASVTRTFDLRAAWNGVGDFPTLRQEGAIPALPLVDPGALVNPAVALERPGRLRIEFPAEAPAGATAAALMPADGLGGYSLTYAGGGRVLSILATADTVSNRAEFSTDGAVETVSLGGRSALLRRAAAGSFAALVEPAAGGRRRSILRVEARGFERDELVAVLRSLAPLSAAALREQAALFARPGDDRASVEALLAAIERESAPAPAEGQALYTVATTFVRQAGAADPLGDPYHRPPYGGRPAELTQQSWLRASSASSPPERYTVTRGASGTVYERRYQGPGGDWLYRAPEQMLLSDVPGAAMGDGQPRATLLRLLICGARLQATPDGSAVAITEQGWMARSCAHPTYPQLARAQRQRLGVDRFGLSPDSGPMLSDLAETSITTLAYLDADGRATRIETRAGAGPDGTLLESWLLSGSALLPASQIPPTATEPAPQPIFTIALSETAALPSAVVFRPVTITEALSLAQTPLLAPPADVTQGWYAAATPGGRPTPLDAGEWPLDVALWQGAAVQLEMQAVVTATGQVERVRVYQGPAARFAALLRARASWQSSAPASFELGGRQVDGWVVETARGRWVLGELGGTLVAFPDDGGAREAVRGLRVVPAGGT